MIDINRNNLDQAVSPYLRQHAGNPVWWQEWGQEILGHARRENRPLFVSVGYATCHWCHVMAAEAFSDKDVADFLNANFISIKVDREQRPDIDQFLMHFVVGQNGSGGWPLNCLLTPDVKPFFALTYAPLKPQYGMPGFLEILRRANNQYSRLSQQYGPYSMPMDQVAENVETDFVTAFEVAFDFKFGGFGEGTKFPPHSTLLFMLYYFAASGDGRVKSMLETTLDNILSRGLHDHLQGGFFRYCIDRKWSVPHFEKMLYDQGMLLWVYSLAFRILQKEAYRTAAVKLIQCLQETFEDHGLYYSGHDADTAHEEGACYLWSREELLRALAPEEYAEFEDIYHIQAEGKNHLVKDRDIVLKNIEAKLLAERKKRLQPLVDRKIITSWNCLAGIGLVHAYRYAGVRSAFAKAETLAKELLRRHFSGGILAHSSCGGEVQKQGFLQDYASLLLLLTYLDEETGRWGDEIQEFRRKIMFFRQERGWFESLGHDFFPVPADAFDQPVPSSVSLAEFALLRADILSGQDHGSRPYRMPLNNDFYNVVSLMANGFFHIVETPVNIEWDKLQVNSFQKRGSISRDCYHGSCREFVLPRAG